MSLRVFRSSGVATVVALCAAVLVQGCAVPSSQVEQAVGEQSLTAQQLQERSAQQRRQESVLTRVKGNYVGGLPVELGHKVTLPQAFQDVTLRFPDAPNLRVVAERITAVTRIPVSLAADAVVASAGPSTAGAAIAPLDPASVGSSGMIPMDFRGHLADYLDQVSARSGLGWSYFNGTIQISRQVTRTFQLAASPGSVSYGSRVSKGSSASTGSTGGTGAATTGSFTGASDTGVEAKQLSAWDAIRLTITSMLGSNGRLNLNEVTGTVVVTDTRTVVDQIGRLIEHENNLLTRQVSLQVQMLTLEINDQSQLGVDVNPIYKALSGEVRSSVVGSLTGASAGSLSFNVLSGRGAGSSVNVRALEGLGKIVGNTSTTLVTTHRVPVPLAQFATQGYLASTTASSGGASSGGAGVPGLTPGSVTTGLFISALPTILDSGALLLRLSVDNSTLKAIESQSTGSGQTFQQIQIPSVTGIKSDHNITLHEGQTLVLVGMSSESITGQNQLGLLGGSMVNRKARQVQIISVTPRVHSGI
jgi:type IVB pilus formation R64 PilN family outer membrane protein